MVKFVAKDDVNMNKLAGFDVLKDPLGTRAKDADENGYTVSSDDVEAHVVGKNFQYTSYVFFKIPQEGTVTKVTFSIDGKDAYVINNFKMTLSELASNFDSMSPKEVLADMMSGNDRINGSKFADNLRGFAGDDVINGKKSKDKLAGDEGDDTLNGGRGKDLLTGGAGSDNFVFSDKVVAGNRKTIKDFGVGNDQIHLQLSDFDALGAKGALNPAMFFAGADATTPGQHVIYNSATGDLFFDANGSNPGEKTLIFKLVAGTALDASHILVI